MAVSRAWRAPALARARLRAASELPAVALTWRLLPHPLLVHALWARQPVSQQATVSVSALAWLTRR